ncbi:hypothetical protein [Amphritea sp.]|uniref:hypothetical protein n=1 Tax=Amphritea sp. TaxID=1872502 RepID=UPI003A8CE365
MFRQMENTGLQDLAIWQDPTAYLQTIITPAASKRLQYAIIAAATNSQRAARHPGKALPCRGILDTPDYPVNGGGLTFAALHHSRQPHTAITHNITLMSGAVNRPYPQANVQYKNTSTTDDLRAERLTQQARLAEAYAA